MGRGLGYTGSRNATVDLYQTVKATQYAWGFIESVDTNKGLMDVRLSPSKVLQNIRINLGPCGPYHGIRVIPKKNDMVLLGYEQDNNIFHLTTIPYHYVQWTQTPTSEPADPAFPNSNKLKQRRLNEGEMELMACDNDGLPACSISLLKDGTIEMKSLGDKKSWRAGQSETSEVQHQVTNADQSRVIAGQVQRKNVATGNMEVKAFGGVPYVGVGSALNEIILKVGQGIGPDGSDLGTPTVAVKLSDQLLDDLGVPIVDKTGQFIQADIQLKNGAHITINQLGQININEASDLIMPQKKVARNGDKVETPISTSYVDALHPGQSTLALGNIAEISKLLQDLIITIPIGAVNVVGSPSAQSNPAPIIISFSPLSGITYVPSQTVKLSGEIVEGAEGVIVGDNTPLPKIV